MTVRFVSNKELVEYDVLRAFVIQTKVLTKEEVEAVEKKHAFLQSACEKELRAIAISRSADLHLVELHILKILSFYRDLQQLKTLVEHFESRLSGQPNYDQAKLLPCPICGGQESCDHSVPERYQADLVRNRPDSQELAQFRRQLKEQLEGIIVDLI